MNAGPERIGLRETDMAKGQKRSNKEQKKPKQKKEDSAVANTAANRDAPLAIGSTRKVSQK